MFTPGQNGSVVALAADIDARLELGQITQTDHDRWIATLTKAISGANSRAVSGYVSMVVHRELLSSLSHH